MAKCEDCKYFEKDDTYSSTASCGFCFRYPPSVLSKTLGDEDIYDPLPVYSDGWCGEFEGKLQNIPFSLDGFPHGHAVDVKRFLRIAKRTSTDSEYKIRFPDLHLIETMDDFLSLKKEEVLSCKSIGIVTWREIHLLQEKIRQKLKL